MPSSYAPPFGTRTICGDTSKAVWRAWAVASIRSSCRVRRFFPAKAVPTRSPPTSMATRSRWSPTSNAKTNGPIPNIASSSQAVSAGPGQPFGRGLAGASGDAREWLDYRIPLKRWSEAIGDDKVTVRVYDSTQLVEGDVIADFARATNLPAIASLPPPTGVRRKRRAAVRWTCGPVPADECAAVRRRTSLSRFR